MTDWQSRAEFAEAKIAALIYAVSHDLQEPVRKVSSFSKLLLRSLPELDENQTKWAGYIDDGTARLQKMIQALLLISRVGRETRPPSIQDTAMVVQACWTRLDTQPGDELILGDLPSVEADTEQYYAIWSNLLKNALIFREGPVKVEISATADDFVQFEIQDNGIGIVNESLERIFELFQRLHGRDEGYPGVGAGLSYCRSIIEAHGGKIWAESEEGKGSRFFFTWPTIATHDGRT